MTGDINLSGLIWGFADILYNKIESANYHKVILPMTLLRRFDCILSEPGADGRSPAEQALSLMPTWGALRSGTEEERTKFDRAVLGYTQLRFYNVSGLSFKDLAASSPSQVLDNFKAYIEGFSDNVKDILSNFSFTGNTPTCRCSPTRAHWWAWPRSSLIWT